MKRISGKNNKKHSLKNFIVNMLDASIQMSDIDFKKYLLDGAIEDFNKLFLMTNPYKKSKSHTFDDNWFKWNQQHIEDLKWQQEYIAHLKEKIYKLKQQR